MSFKQTILFPSTPTTERGVSTKLSANKGRITYGNGRTAVIRDFNDPTQSKVFSGHTQNVTVARISPTGYYCASADITGTVKVWDLVGEDQTVKGDYKALAGRVNDLEWDGESKRIIAVGDGRGKYGHAFMMDTGTTTGEITGHNKAINAVSIRHQRPFRAATAGDDTQIIFHQGVPWKFDKTIKTHTKFVQDVRFSPSGDHFASVGSDFKAFLYDGKTGDTLGELPAEHKGSVMACTWSPDNKFLVTSSADRTVKLWDVEAKKAVTTWSVGTAVDHQQVGNVWSGDEDIVSLSLSGDLNVFDRRTGDAPARVLKGPQKSVTSTSLPSPGTFLAGTADGRVISYNCPSFAKAEIVSGAGHSNLVSGLSSAPSGGVTWSIGYDDKVREVTPNGSFSASVLSTASQPKSIATSDDGTIFVAELDGVEAFKSGSKVSTLKTSYTPTSVASIDKLVAVGGEDNKVHLYTWTGSELKEDSVLDSNRAVVSAVAISPDGKLLAAGESSGKIFLYSIPEKKLITSRWSFHTGRVNSVVFTRDSKQLASGSLDTNVYIWSVDTPGKNIAIKGAVPGGVNGVTWVKEGEGKGATLAGAGADGCVRVWEVVFH